METQLQASRSIAGTWAASCPFPSLWDLLAAETRSELVSFLLCRLLQQKSKKKIIIIIKKIKVTARGQMTPFGQGDGAKRGVMCGDGERAWHRGKLSQTVMNGQDDEKIQPYLLPLVTSDSRMLIRILIVNISSGEASSIFSSLLEHSR